MGWNPFRKQNSDEDLAWERVLSAAVEAGVDKYREGYEAGVKATNVVVKPKPEKATSLLHRVITSEQRRNEQRKAVVKDKKKGKRPPHRRRSLEQDTARLIDWFTKRNNKWLTKNQIQTMSISPLKGIARASFYRVVQDDGKFEKKFKHGKRETRYRLAYAGEKGVPRAPQLYGASLTIMMQQLMGGTIPITVHRKDCHWSKQRTAEWLYAVELPELYGKIGKLFTQRGNGKTPVIKRCKSCHVGGRLPAYSG